LLRFCAVCKTSPNTDVYTAYNFKDLTECISQVERIETRVNSKKRKWLTKKEEEETQRGREEEIPAITLDSYFIKNNTNYR
jgi:glycerol kinase